MTIRTGTITYGKDGLSFTGFLAYDDALEAPRPGVLVAHEAPGLGEHPKRRAVMLAESGYTAFALDMYGDGRVFLGPEAMDQLQALLRVPGRVRERAVLGYQAMCRLPEVDVQRIAAIGYCLGGRCVVELARSAADVRGVVSFHGLLDRGTEADERAIRGKVLAFTGAEDPMMPAERVLAFQEGLRAAGVDWQVVTYGRARHAFTNRDAGLAGHPALAFDEQADQRAWGAMQNFLGEVLA